MWEKVVGTSTSGKNLVALLGTSGENTKSLSGEHGDILDRINKNKAEIDNEFSNIGSLIKPQKDILSDIKRDIDFRNERLLYLNPNQNQMMTAVNYIPEMMESWQNSIREVEKQKQIIEDLKKECEILRKENQALKQTQSRLSSDIQSHLRGEGACR